MAFICMQNIMIVGLGSLVITFIFTDTRFPHGFTQGQLQDTLCITTQSLQQ